VFTSKTKNEEKAMRLLLLATAATFVITGTAMADDTAKTHAKHHRDANASAEMASDVTPDLTLTPHDARLKNLRDSGYNAKQDIDAYGNIRQN
jgi:hypothetical protein